MFHLRNPRKILRSQGWQALQHSGNSCSSAHHAWLQQSQPRRAISLHYGYASAQCLTFSKFGNPREVLRLHSHSISPAYGDQITVRFLASPINPADINQIEGVYPTVPKFHRILGTSEDCAVAGNEGLVEIVSCGSKVDSSIRPGQWAIMAQPSFGTWRTFASARESDLLFIKNKEGLSALQCATVGVNPCTAYRMLRDYVDLKPGDFFIQNGANSGVGRSAIQFGKLWGLRSINIIRDRPDANQLKQELRSIGATEVLTEVEARNKEYISNITEGNSIILGLNCVGGDSATNLTKHLSHGGHLVTYGAMSKKPLQVAAGSLIFKNLHFHGFWISQWSSKHPGKRLEMVDEILEKMRDKKFENLPYETVPWTDSTKLPSLLDAVERGISGFSGKKYIFVMDDL